jgi:opacity protein-like surface antigen
MKGGFLMKRVVSSLVVFLFVMGLSFFPLDTASAQSGGYVGAFGGYTFGSDSTLGGAYGYNFDLDADNSAALGIKVGYTPPQINYLSFELEYSYFNADFNRTVSPLSATDYTAFEGDSSFHNLLYNMILRYPAGTIHPYFGAGLGFSFVDVSAVVTARIAGVDYREPINDDDASFAWQMLLGVDIDLTNNFSLDIGYRYLSTEPKFSSTGSTELDYKTSMVTLGFKYRF